MRRLRVALAVVQRRVARALGVIATQRSATVIAMLDGNVRRAPGYWLQLVLATGIATLGLVLGSTAVVIGGMLVSPLMGPIVELGMGFAVGSSLLVLRSSLRVTASVVIVIAVSTIITLLVPFHEVTGEIAARTAPTLLDLLVAVFCALAAAYTTVRPTADTTAAAAGTAIGIALVPPLCATGFGLGTGAALIAGGAVLLFTANLSAILVVAVLSFLLLGYDEVDAAKLEHSCLERSEARTERLAERLHALLGRLFGSRYGLAMRVLIPLAFLAAVYAPLRGALDEVAWQVRTREAIRRVLAVEAPGAMQTSIVVERRAVSLRLVTVGTDDHAAMLERQLTARIASAAGTDPHVTVTAVPDARLLAAAVSRAELAPVEAPPRVHVDALTQRVADELLSRWPASAAGTMVGWSLNIVPPAGAVVTVRHVGPPLGAAGEALLGAELTRTLGTTTVVRDVNFPSAPILLFPGREVAWLARVLPLLPEVGGDDSTLACVGVPASRRRRTGADRSLRAALDSSRAGRLGRIRYLPDSAWSFRVARRVCGTPPPEPGRP